MAKNYTVRVTNEFRSIVAGPRLSAGLSIPQDGVGYEGPLSKEQLDELKADRYVLVLEGDEPVDGQVDTTPKNTEQENAQAAEAQESAPEQTKEATNETPAEPVVDEQAPAEEVAAPSETGVEPAAPQKSTKKSSK